MEKIDYVERMRYSSDPELWYYDDIEIESCSVIMEEAYEEYGERFVRQLAKVPDSHHTTQKYLTRFYILTMGLPIFSDSHRGFP